MTFSHASTLLALSVTQVLSGSVLELAGTPARTIEDVPVYPGAKLATGETLRLTGAGARVKKIFLVQVSVYVVASYVDDVAAVKAGEPLDGFKKTRYRALQLTFLHEVPADRVRGGFIKSLKESLEANGVDPSTGPVAEALSKITGALPAKRKLTLVGRTGGNAQRLTCELPNGTEFSVSGKDVVDSFWKIWFGKPSDDGLQDLKPQLSGK